MDLMNKGVNAGLNSFGSESAQWRDLVDKISFNWYSGGGVQLSQLGTAATNCIFCQLRVITMEKLVG
jgi:hypothetical protein